MKKLRFLKMEFFVPLEFFLIVGLLNAPAPFVTIYSARSVIVSLSLGTFLGIIAFLNAIMQVIQFKTHLLFATLVGIACLGYAYYVSAAEPFARNCFLLLGGSLVFISIFVRPEIPQAAERQQKPEGEDVRRAA